MFVQASWLGGSYAVDPLEALNGDLAIPLASGATISLHMSKVFIVINIVF